MNKTLILSLSLLIAGNAQANDASIVNKIMSSKVTASLVAFTGVAAGFGIPFTIGGTGPNKLVDWVQKKCNLEHHSAAAQTCMSVASLGIIGLGLISLKAVTENSLLGIFSTAAAAGGTAALAAGTCF